MPQVTKSGSRRNGLSWDVVQHTGRKEEQKGVRRGGEGTEHSLSLINLKKKKSNLLFKKVGQREHRVNAKQRAI